MNFCQCYTDLTLTFVLVDQFLRELWSILLKFAWTGMGHILLLSFITLIFGISYHYRMNPQQEWTPKHGDFCGTASTALSKTADLSYSRLIGIYVPCLRIEFKYWNEVKSSVKSFIWHLIWKSFGVFRTSRFVAYLFTYKGKSSNANLTMDFSNILLILVNVCCVYIIVCCCMNCCSMYICFNVGQKLLKLMFFCYYDMPTLNKAYLKNLILSCYLYATLRAHFHEFFFYILKFTLILKKITHFDKIQLCAAWKNVKLSVEGLPSWSMERLDV